METRRWKYCPGCGRKIARFAEDPERKLRSLALTFWSRGAQAHAVVAARGSAAAVAGSIRHASSITTHQGSVLVSRRGRRGQEGQVRDRKAAVRTDSRLNGLWFPSHSLGPETCTE